MMFRMAGAVVNCPSGFGTVSDCGPAIAVTGTVTLTVILVGFANVTLLTITPPLTAAAIWLEKPGPPVSGPGSKNSEPPIEVPVMTRLMLVWRWVRLVTETLRIAAGGGAFN